MLSTPRRILITGASRGIGKQAALQLARRGHSLVLAARSRTALERVAAQITAEGGRAEVLPMDVTDDASTRAAIAHMLASAPCDVVVNNAGTCLQGQFLAQEPERLREEMELNYWGAQRVTRAVLPAMIARGAGTIVNVSSLLGIVAAPTTCNYSASKAALNAWTHGLRGEVARFGVRLVVFVAPHTQTELGAATEFDGVHSLPVEYTALELCRAIDHAPRQYAASPVYRLLIEVAGWFPRFMERRVAASVKRLLA
ncbi:MAG TPA: SDR family NAD(P)-dependent oxidoreductase [Polyangiales bacterium]|nr:SDR family NAD(P)-dependent oxidoreductase [Polyangiales bacterium]